ncbi:enoyl-CoA hydratase [Comamonas serinivorans]|uniref:Enoyl-CoA hydratase n=1 Tax=Comamonas serinivorans TaxID=1082851 RepID=A0A1Y0EQQ3_9BURK|nr:enoyl-CoA hydratase-related protein [Comamonas serinivorans]ARU05731.1 enoyl-CoA hydratase [Comamonas serinivorans]
MADVTVELLDGVQTITLTRPDKKNALTNDMYGALADALEAAEAQPEIRATVFQGDGDMFTAGNDLGDFAKQSSGAGPAVRHVARFLKNLANATTPLVAAVQGKAVGVGTTLLLHCDLVVLADDAELVTPFVNLALVPEAASTWLIPQRIGYARAYEMFALGEPVSAQRALDLGLANRVVPLPDLRAQANRLARQLASKPAGSLTAMKRLMRDAAFISAQMDREGEVFQQRLKSAEAREAFAAFAEKRKPDFSKLSA